MPEPSSMDGLVRLPEEGGKDMANSGTSPGPQPENRRPQAAGIMKR